MNPKTKHRLAGALIVFALLLVHGCIFSMESGKIGTLAGLWVTLAFVGTMLLFNMD